MKIIESLPVTRTLFINVLSDWQLLEINKIVASRVEVHMI